MPEHTNLNVAELLADLVRIDSRNLHPMSSKRPRESDERAMCAFLVPLLENLGFATTVQEAAPNRPNLVAYAQRDPAYPTLAFQAHMDTVGTSGMTIEPFEPQIRDGRLYGRGAADTKGPMAAMLCALEALGKRDLPLNLMFIGTCAEETGCEGVRHLDLSPWPINGIVVGEPTGNQPIYGHKSHVSVELVCKGTAAHGSTPTAGDNAIYHMSDVIDYLRRIVIPRLQAESLAPFGPATLSVGVIRGGSRSNIVPDSCRAHLDMRLLPDMDIDGELHRLLAELQEKVTPKVAIKRTHVSPGLFTPPESNLVKALCLAMERYGKHPEPGTVNYCTDAGILASQGYPAVIFGPGDILNAHGPVEFIALEELREAVGILIQTGVCFASQPGDA